VGDCHRYDYTAMQRPTEPAPTVSCAGGTATAVTIAVLPLPAGAQLPFADHPTSVQAAGRSCQAQLDAYLGGGPALPISRLGVAFFEPTPSQVAAGQRWVRCDLDLAGIAPTGKPLLLPLPNGSLKGALAGAGAWTYALCANPTGPNATDWLATVDCRSAGSQVAVVPVPIAPTGAPYPGVTKATAQATRVCALVSRWYGGLRLRGVPEPAKAWAGGALCLSSPGDFQGWIAAGRPFTSPQNTA
jgi:hypothetical protein